MGGFCEIPALLNPAGFPVISATNVDLTPPLHGHQLHVVIDSTEWRSLATQRNVTCLLLAHA